MNPDPLRLVPAPELDAFLSEFARLFGLTDRSGHVVVKTVWVNGEFRKSETTRTMGRDDLERGIGSAA